MFKQVITGVLAAVAAIAVLAWSRRGERPIVYVPDPSTAQPLPPGSWPPLEVPATRPATPPTTRPDGIPWDRPIPQLKLERVTLEQAMAKLSAAAGVNIVVGVRSLETLGIDRAQKLSLDLKDVSLRAAMHLILNEAAAGAGGLGWSVVENVIFVGASDLREPEGLVTRVYNVRDLVVEALRFSKGLEPISTRPTPAEAEAVETIGGGTEPEVAESLRAAIFANVDPSNWADNGGAYGTVSYFAGLLVIHHRPEVHARIEALLGSLRGRR